jgi:hypothetical protein
VTAVQAPTLAEFLLARIAYDEHGARMLRDASDDLSMVELRLGHRIVERVLAECEAKRRIVHEFDRLGSMDADGQADGGAAAMAIMDGLEVAMRALALPYADHEDYRQEWKP